MLGIVTITLDPAELLVWALIGLVVGFFATRVMLGHGLGVFADVVVGVLGALAGGFLAALFGVTLDIPGHPYISEGVIAFLGAVVLLGVMRVLGVGRRRGALRR
ncbi:MAG: GlsB/YeaQ/YmgE family stress response membrane protein [Candidatus Dormibacteria bacterium]|jgi:uncharacterized membrane protein YeaQ/YmgE (transglycosylase-associated protein family)